MRRGKYTKALHIFTEELERNPNSGEIWLAAGSVMLTMGKCERAEEALLVAKQLDVSKWRVHLQLGHTYTQMGCPIPARRSFRESMSWAPEQPESRVYLWFTQLNDGKWDDDAGNFALALQHALGHPGAIAGAAIVRYYRQANEDAWTLVEPRLRGPKPDVRILVVGADLAKQLGRSDPLLSPLERGLKQVRTTSNKVLLLHSLGNLHDQLGNHNQAFTAFEQANTIRKLPYDIQGHVEMLAMFPKLFPLTRLACIRTRTDGRSPPLLRPKSNSPFTTAGSVVPSRINPPLGP